MAICKSIERCAPIQPAMRAQGIHETYQDWERMAMEGTDPFWAWAMTCMQMAEGQAIVDVTNTLKEKIEQGDTRAMTFFLSKRSNAYRDKREVEVNHVGGQTHTVLVGRLDQLLAEGRLSIADAVAGHRALQGEEIDAIDVEIEELEPHPLFRTRIPEIQDG